MDKTTQAAWFLIISLPLVAQFLTSLIVLCLSKRCLDSRYEMLLYINHAIGFVSHLQMSRLLSSCD